MIYGTYTSSRYGARVAVICALVATSEAPAQVIRSEPSAAEIAASLRTKGQPGTALMVLTQARGPQPRQKMDEIADTLVAIAVKFSGDGLRAAQTRSAALGTLLHAGMGARAVGISGAVPYAGAGERLMKIVETAGDVGIREAALSGVRDLLNNATVVPFLQTIATSQNPIAYRAVVVLSTQSGPEGRAIARKLHQEHRVTEPFAKETLSRLAISNLGR